MNELLPVLFGFEEWQIMSIGILLFMTLIVGGLSYLSESGK